MKQYITDLQKYRSDSSVYRHVKDNLFNDHNYIRNVIPVDYIDVFLGFQGRRNIANSIEMYYNI